LHGLSKAANFAGKQIQIMQNNIPISNIMTQKPATVSPADNLETVRQIFENHWFHHIPVVEDGKLVGIVSYTDYLRIIRALYDNAEERRGNEQALHHVAVREVMTAHPLCLSPSDTVGDALRIFKTNHFHALPVIEGDRRLVGIVSTHDLVRLLERVLAPEIDYAA